MSALNLQTVEGISPEGAELLRAVGVEGIAILAMCQPDDLLDEMKLANQHLELVDNLPSREDLEGWIGKASEIDQEERPEFVMRLEDEVEIVPIDVFTAVPITKEYIVEHQIAVGEVPVMTAFCSEDELVREEVVSRRPDEAMTASVREIAPRALTVKALQEAGGNIVKTEITRKRIDPLKRSPGIDLRKTASPKLNTGRKAHSRRFIRGVLHPQRLRVKIGAFFTLMAQLFMPLSFLAGILILTLFKGQVLDHPWLLAIPAAFLVFGVLYLFQARPIRCRVCGQPIFSPKACRRNPKGHRILLLGYIFPTCIQLLLFHWFRCMYCGTSVRLKE